MVARGAFLALGLLVSISMASSSATVADLNSTNEKLLEAVTADEIPTDLAGAPKDKNAISSSESPKVSTATTRKPDLLKIPSYLSQVCRLSYFY